ncbi:MAG TPA: DUF5009 domain-containing protein [Armatimonadota bacterium]|jgi:predicted acyltransferase
MDDVFSTTAQESDSVPSTREAHERQEDQQRPIHLESTAAVTTTTPAPSPRLRSLDAFRGLVIALMLLVNNIALDTATPLQLVHAPWHEMVRLADLVFPWFLLCTGIAIPFSAASYRKRGGPAWRYDLKLLGRCASLVLLGCLIESSLIRHPLLSLGVLQVIGFAFLIGAWLYDLPLARRLLIAAGLLTAYWAAIKFLPVPGMNVGILDEQHNLIWYLNSHFFAGGHFGELTLSLWGLPSIIPTAALVLIGTAIGDLLRITRLHVLTKSLLLIALGITLAWGGFQWNHSLLFSKAIWSPSYILLAAGTGTMLLGLFTVAIDAWPRVGLWSYPLTVFGANAILAYVAPILVKVYILEEWHLSHGQTIEQWGLSTLSAHWGPIVGGWSYTGLYMLGWWLILWQLYRKRVFIRV